MSHVGNDFDPRWDEEEEDRAQLEEDREKRLRNEALRSKENRSPGGDDRRRRRRSRSSSVSRSRSPVVRSAVNLAESNIDSRIERVLDAKLEGFLGKVKEVVSQKGGEDIDGVSGQMESLQLGQKELKRRQQASAMKTDGGRFQYLALSNIKGKIESAEKIVGGAVERSYTMSSTQMLELKQCLESARTVVDQRMDLVYRADTLPNGFRILTAFQKRVQQSELGSNPEQEKLWNEVAKQVEAEKKKSDLAFRAKRSTQQSTTNATTKGDQFFQLCLCKLIA